MALSNYLKESFRLSSLIFTLLVMINWLINRQILVRNLHILFVFAVISGLFSFLLREQERYSNRRLVINQVIYIGIICLLIIIGNYLFNWKFTIWQLLINLLMVIVIFLFNKFIMYSNDKKDAQSINEFIQQRQDNQP